MESKRPFHWAFMGNRMQIIMPTVKKFRKIIFQVNTAFPKQQDIMVLKLSAKSELFPR